MLCTFWLWNVLRATTACNCSPLIWPDGSAPAALASLLFDPPAPQIIEKTQCFATFLPFRASASSFFWLFLFSDCLSSTLLFSLTLSISAFHLSILSEVWLLNFLRLWTTLLFALFLSSRLPCFAVKSAMHKGQERKTAAAGQLRLRPFVCVPSMQFWGCVTAVAAKTLEQQMMTNNK